MSGPFSMLDIARTGMTYNSTWLEVVAHNVANLNDISAVGTQPFRTRILLAATIDDNAPTGGGVEVDRIVDTAGDAPLVYDPSHPLADASGYVQGSVGDLAQQMTELVMASRSYQANISVHQDARESLEAAASVGRR
jgi:flagellar basal-body rod protein FlgC